MRRRSGEMEVPAVPHWGAASHQGTAETSLLPALLPVAEKGTEPEKPKQGSCLATHGPGSASPPPETSKRAVSSPNMPPEVAWWPWVCLGQATGAGGVLLFGRLFSRSRDHSEREHAHARGRLVGALCAPFAASHHPSSGTAAGYRIASPDPAAWPHQCPPLYRSTTSQNACTAGKSAGS